MGVFELKVEVALEAVPLIEDALAEGEEQRVMLWEDREAARAWITGYFTGQGEAETAWREIAEGFQREWVRGNLEVRALPDADWKESYRAHFRAWEFGHLHWVPVWERDKFKLPPGHEVLWLDPGMAFGTGNHETTRLVAEHLVIFASRRGTAGNVIDAGCGSGILALSAAKLGFQRVVAFDNDPVAIDVSVENARMNQLEAAVEFHVGDLESGLSGRKATLVLANIQADVLIQFARNLVAAVEDGGELVLSGILARELAQVAGAFSAIVPSWNQTSRVAGEWSSLALQRF